MAPKKKIRPTSSMAAINGEPHYSWQENLQALLIEKEKLQKEKDEYYDEVFEMINKYDDLYVEYKEQRNLFWDMKEKYRLLSAEFEQMKKRLDKGPGSRRSPSLFTAEKEAFAPATDISSIHAPSKPSIIVNPPTSILPCQSDKALQTETFVLDQVTEPIVKPHSPTPHMIDDSFSKTDILTELEASFVQIKEKSVDFPEFHDFIALCQSALDRCEQLRPSEDKPDSSITTKDSFTSPILPPVKPFSLHHQSTSTFDLSSSQILLEPLAEDDQTLSFDAEENKSFEAAHSSSNSPKPGVYIDQSTETETISHITAATSTLDLESSVPHENSSTQTDFSTPIDSSTLTIETNQSISKLQDQLNRIKSDYHRLSKQASDRERALRSQLDSTKMNEQKLSTLQTSLSQQYEHQIQGLQEQLLHYKQKDLSQQARLAEAEKSLRDLSNQHEHFNPPSQRLSTSKRRSMQKSRDRSFRSSISLRFRKVFKRPRASFS